MEINDQERLLAFWNEVFASEETEPREAGPDLWRSLAPSEKLFRAAVELGLCENVLDYGCGSGWAGIIAAMSGCERVLCADAAPNAVAAAERNIRLSGAQGRATAVLADGNAPLSLPRAGFDGLICSNVLDVVPPSVSEELLRRFWQVTHAGARVVIGLNFCLPEGRAPRPGERLEEGRLYVNGVLRLVSRSDEEWERAFEPYFTLDRLEHFAWPGEKEETRRLFFLRRDPVPFSPGIGKRIDRVSLLVLRSGRLLTARSRGKDAFYIPGGKREAGESDTDALLRETREELGVGLVPGSIRFFGVFCGPAHGKPEGTRVRHACYLAETDGTPVPSSEVEELRWQGADSTLPVPPADEAIYRELVSRGLLIRQTE